MTTQHIALHVLHRNTGFHRHKGAHASRVQNASLPDHTFARQTGLLHGQVRHRVERVRQNDKERVRRMFEGFSGSIAHDLGIGLEQVFTAHTRFAGNSSRNDDDV